MGTKVECKSYFPGYYSMSDLNDEANGVRWPLHYEDKTLKSRQYYNSFVPRPPTDGYSEYDKEVLKQTMLKHEAVFRIQVSELHRLYRIQRNLMDELKRKELHKYPIPLEASQPNALLSQMPSEDSQSMWHVPSIPLLNSTCSKPSVSGADNMQSPSKFIKESCMQSEATPAQNGGSFKDCEVLESKFIKLPRTFDLQLPADEYIESEQEECLKEEKDSQVSLPASYPLKSNCRVAPESDINMSGGDGNPGCRGDASKSDLCLLNKRSLADLNEPIQDEKPTSSAPANNCFRPVACHLEFQGLDMPVEMNSGFLGLPKEFFQNTQKSWDNGTHISVQHLESEGSKREWSSYNLEAGQSRSKLNSFSQGFCPEKYPTPSKLMQAAMKKPCELPAFLLADHAKREPWNESAICGIEISKRSESLCNFSGPIEIPCIPNTYPIMPQSDVSNSGSSSVSSWKNPMSSLSQNPSPGLISDKWHLSSNLRSNLSFGSEVSYQNGFCHGPQSGPKSSPVCSPSVGFPYLNCSNDKTSATEHFENRIPAKYYKGLDCIDVKSAKDINLNLALPNGFQEGIIGQQDLVTIDGEVRNEDTLGSLPWLRTKPTCGNGPTKGRGGPDQNGLGLLEAYSRQFAHKIEKERVPTPCFVQDSMPASCACDAEDQRIELGKRPSNKRIFGFPIFEEPDISKNRSSLTFPSKLLPCLSESEAIQNGQVEVLNIDSSHNPALPDSCQKNSTENSVVVKGLDKDLSGFRNHINLNSCADEEEAPSTCNIRRATIQIVPEIDLEAPIVPETAEGIPPAEESMGNQLETAVQSLLVEVPDTSSEELVRIVAEAIVNISSLDVHNHLEDDMCHPLETSLSESLHWLAEVIASYAGDVDSKEGGVVLKRKSSSDHDESSSDEIDYFESMTLKLTETKVDEYWCKPWAPENQTEEEKGDSRLSTQRRKGQARGRGRQRRDFQGDILPGLASLSRHEVTEDLQTFGGMMRATGHPWQIRLVRSAARNGWASGSRRSQDPAPIMPASTMCLPPRQQPNVGELGLEEGCLKGWGRRTRRQRCQRYAVGNPPIPLTQV